MPYLYTVYQSAYNMRLEQCPDCHAFADPYVEHDTLTLLIDLILLKRGVYRHLLYNRGAKPRRVVESKKSEDGKLEDEVYMADDWERESSRWALVVRLGLALVFVDAFIRWSYLTSDHRPAISPWSLVTIDMFAKTFIGCLAETVAFHGGVVMSCFLLQRLLDAAKKELRGRQSTKEQSSAIKREFRFSLIPLSLFYSSLTKLFLLFLLTIWRPSRSPSSSDSDDYTRQPVPWATSVPVQQLLNSLEFLEDDKLDRAWIVRNVLGGMSAGFGLRVILDSHPVFTTFIILIGWATKTAVARFVGNWIGGDRLAEIWMAYSIP
ncbi:sterol homeostasis protein [Marasmius crinis-equi]|uniref:Protein ARV n=1 Tax=Marasmius crinis-equi TaxID=585013 RepID=A0ABR3FRI6_9AGAR